MYACRCDDGWLAGYPPVCLPVSVFVYISLSVFVYPYSYDDGWLAGYPPRMGPPMGHGGRFIRPPGPPVSGRGAYRTSGKFITARLSQSL